MVMGFDNDITNFLQGRTPIPGKAISNRDGDFVPGNEYVAALPMRARDLAKEMGHVCRYFNVDPGTFSFLLERCLQENLDNGSIEAYKSSVKSAERVHGNVKYYAILHVDAGDRNVLENKPVTACSQSSIDMSSASIRSAPSVLETVVISVHEHPGGGAVVLVSATDVQKYDALVKRVHEVIHDKQAEMGMP